MWSNTDPTWKDPLFGLKNYDSDSICNFEEKQSLEVEIRQDQGTRDIENICQQYFIPRNYHKREKQNRMQYNRSEQHYNNKQCQEQQNLTQNELTQNEDSQYENQSRRKNKQMRDNPQRAAQKCVKRQVGRALTSSNILKPKQLQQIIQKGSYKRKTNENDLFVFLYLGGVDLLRGKEGKEMQEFKNITQVLQKLIQKVKKDKKYSGSTTKCGEIVCRWITSLILAIKTEIIENANFYQNKKEQIQKLVQEFYKRGSKDPNRSKKKVIERNSKQYLSLMNQ